MIGTSIENYRIDEVLGHGGMGVVYKAMDTSLDRVVALKVMNPSFAADEEFLWRFKSEAKVLGRLLHPNIVNVYAFRHIQPHLFIVMEYVDGGTLSSLIDSHDIIPYRQGIPILKQCLIALEVAHNANIIHRDIKPQNILLTRDKEVKISDFGLAKIQENTSTSVTRVGVTGGTIYYMPPEQSVALSDVDHRGDIYSLGMTMYQMLAGRMPFDEGSSTLTILKAIDEQRIPVPNTFNPHMPSGIADIIMRAIKKDRSERFQSALEMRVAIEQFEASSEAQGPPSTGTRIYAPPQKTQIHSPTGRQAPKPPRADRASAKAVVDHKSLSKPWFAQKAVLLAGILIIAAIITAVIFTSSDDSVDRAAQTNDPVASQVLEVPETTTNETTTNETTELPTPPGEDNSGNPSNTNQPAPSNRPATTTSSVKQSLLITSSPSQARLFIDGNEVGSTPFQLKDLDARSYNLQLRRSGFQTWQGSVNPASRSRMAVTLSQLQGTVKVIVRPFGDIAIDGASRAKNTNATFETTLDAGGHTITATHPILGKWKKQVQVSPGISMDVLFNFNVEYDVTIISEPNNAEIFIDGVSAKRYTPSQIKLRPGNHSIAVQKRGYSSPDGTKHILLEKKPSSPIAFTLDKNP